MFKVRLSFWVWHFYWSPPTSQVWLPWLYALVFRPTFLPICLLNTDTWIIQTVWHFPSLTALTGFHCTYTCNEILLTSFFHPRGSQEVSDLMANNGGAGTFQRVDSFISRQSTKRFEWSSAVCKIYECNQDKQGDLCGSGVLVNDPNVNDPELSKYCIITSSKVIENAAADTYTVEFSMSSKKSKGETFNLSDIKKKSEEWCFWAGASDDFYSRPFLQTKIF